MSPDLALRGRPVLRELDGRGRPRAAAIHRLFKAHALCNIAMKMVASLSLLLLAAPVSGEPVQRRGDQVEASEALRLGKILPLRDIERRVVPRMPQAEYIGVEFDAYRGVYTLKFLRNGKVIWVEVDGRSGQVLGQTGR